MSDVSPEIREPSVGTCWHGPVWKYTWLISVFDHTMLMMKIGWPWWVVLNHWKTIMVIWRRKKPLTIPLCSKFDHDEEEWLTWRSVVLEDWKTINYNGNLKNTIKHSNELKMWPSLWSRSQCWWWRLVDLDEWSFYHWKTIN